MRTYVETSVISFWFDQRPHNGMKRRLARRFLLSCRNGMHEGVVSNVVYREIGASEEPYRSRDLHLIGRLGLGKLVFDPDQVNGLMEAYRLHPRLAAVPLPDLEHMAAFTVSDLDAMVTYNLRHLANQLMLGHVSEVNHAEGFQGPLVVAPPEAFLPFA